jgi:sugar lactone lactonase YvrE
MFELSRRDALRAAGVGAVAPFLGGVAAGSEHVETVVEIPGERVPENLAIDADGSLYFGITAGEVWRLTSQQTQQTGLALDDLERVVELPGSAIGVEVGPDGALYVASQSEEGTGVWRAPRDGGSPELFAAIDGSGQVFPNDVLYDGEHDRLLVSESFGGAVYELPLDAEDPDGAASVWVESDLLDTESFGANGLTFGPGGAVHVAVTRARAEETDVGRVVGVSVDDDGAASEPATYVESPRLFGADGIATRGPNVYVAANSRNQVVRVSPGGDLSTVASGDDGLVFPSDVAFGTIPRQRGQLFVCNFANQSPEEAAILRANL